MSRAKVYPLGTKLEVVKERIEGSTVQVGDTYTVDAYRPVDEEGQIHSFRSNLNDRDQKLYGDATSSFAEDEGRIRWAFAFASIEDGSFKVISVPDEDS